MNKRTIEIFTAGCPCCEDAVKLVQGLACPSCELLVLDLTRDTAAQLKAKQYGVKRVPAVAVASKLAECCHAGIDPAALRALGVGVEA